MNPFLGKRPIRLAVNRRLGLTLMELMVVITILTILVASAVPVMIPALEQRRTREAARLVHTAFGLARNTAIANGRPAGVLIQPMQRQGFRSGAVLIYQAEVPPPYSGDTIDARVKVELVQRGKINIGAENTKVKLRVHDPNLNVKLVRAGDRMQLNYQGPLYRIAGEAGSEVTLPFTLEADIGDGDVPWKKQGDTAVDKATPELVPYQIFRQPVKTAAPPVLLTGGTVIDLRESYNGSSRGLMGTGGVGTTSPPIIITFAADGSLDRIYGPGSGGNTPGGSGDRLTDSIYLLIGKIDKLDTPDDPVKGKNLKLLTNLWISIGRQTGLVTTSPMSSDIINPRKFAEESQSTGGL